MKFLIIMLLVLVAKVSYAQDSNKLLVEPAPVVTGTYFDEDSRRYVEKTWSPAAPHTVAVPTQNAEYEGWPNQLRKAKSLEEAVRMWEDRYHKFKTEIRKPVTGLYFDEGTRRYITKTWYPENASSSYMLVPHPNEQRGLYENN